MWLSNGQPSRSLVSLNTFLTWVCTQNWVKRPRKWAINGCTHSQWTKPRPEEELAPDTFQSLQCPREWSQRWRFCHLVRRWSLMWARGARIVVEIVGRLSRLVSVSSFIRGVDPAQTLLTISMTSEPCCFTDLVHSLANARKTATVRPNDRMLHRRLSISSVAPEHTTTTTTATLHS